MERVNAVECLQESGTTRGVERRTLDGIKKINQGWTWVVENPFGVGCGDVGRLSYFTNRQEPSKELYKMEAPIGRGKI